MGDATAGVYYRLSDHEEEVGEFLYLQTVVTILCALVLVEDVSHHLLEEQHCLAHCQLRRFLQCM